MSKLSLENINNNFQYSMEHKNNDQGNWLGRKISALNVNGVTAALGVSAAVFGLYCLIPVVWLVGSLAIACFTGFVLSNLMSSSEPKVAWEKEECSQEDNSKISQKMILFPDGSTKYICKTTTTSTDNSIRTTKERTVSLGEETVVTTKTSISPDGGVTNIHTSKASWTR